jgi:hypothetical protein
MVLDGVLVEDRVVRELSALVDRPLANKLERALFFSAEIVALTREEKSAVMSALNRDETTFKDVRERLLIGARRGEIAGQPT